MGHVRTAAALFALALASALPAAEPAEASWEKLKTLVGDWQGRYSDGTTATVSYRLVSNGTALMETLEAPDSSQMVSIYHKDGSSVLMTHYCSLGNQTRMRARALEGGRLGFAYVDATNVTAPDEHVMTGLVMTFPAADRLVHEWTSKTGTMQQTGRFEFDRKK